MVGINSSSFYLPKLTIKNEAKKEFPTWIFQILTVLLLASYFSVLFSF